MKYKYLIQYRLCIGRLFCAAYVHKLAIEFSEGEEIKLIPKLENLKDLFARVVASE